MRRMHAGGNQPCRRSHRWLPDLMDAELFEGSYCSSPDHAVDVAVVKEEDGVESGRLVLAHVAVASHDLRASSQSRQRTERGFKFESTSLRSNATYNTEKCVKLGDITVVGYPRCSARTRLISGGQSVRAISWRP